MDMVQVHAFPCSNVLHEANNVICLSIQFILLIESNYFFLRMKYQCSKMAIIKLHLFF